MLELNRNFTKIFEKLGCKFYKICAKSIVTNYKAMIKEIEENLNKCRDKPCLSIGISMIQCYDVILPINDV